MQGLEIGGMIFEWDDAKAAFNIEKRGISFYEAASVFADSNGILLPDVEHSEDEDRFLLMGLTGSASC